MCRQFPKLTHEFIDLRFQPQTAHVRDCQTETDQSDYSRYFQIILRYDKSHISGKNHHAVLKHLVSIYICDKLNTQISQKRTNQGSSGNDHDKVRYGRIRNTSSGIGSEKQHEKDNTGSIV